MFRSPAFLERQWDQPGPGRGRLVVALLLVDSADRWHWSEDASSAIAFCVHALVRDGLRVVPFDQHGEGDGSLRSLGLDAPAWREWVLAVLGAQTTLSDSTRQRTHDPEQRASALAAVQMLDRPGYLCPGAAALRERLDELWTAYAPLGEAWRQDITTGERGVRNRLSPHEQRWLWKALLPFHERLPTIAVFLVEYVTPVVMALPQTTCLVAPASASADYARQVLNATQQLAAAA
jgi:hypothetical protein